MSATVCKCGHPYEAHRLKYNGPRDASGRATAVEPCIATVTRRRADGDDSWPCPCVNYFAVTRGVGDNTE